MFGLSKPRIYHLRDVAQKSLGQGFLRLIAPGGHMLDPLQSLEDAGLQDGDTQSEVISLSFHFCFVFLQFDSCAVAAS